MNKIKILIYTNKINNNNHNNINNSNNSKIIKYKILININKTYNNFFLQSNKKLDLNSNNKINYCKIYKILNKNL